jgi:hypothetical protein
VINRIKDYIFGPEGKYINYTLKNDETIKIFVLKKCKKTHAQHNIFRWRIEISKYILDELETKEVDSVVHHEICHRGLLATLLIICVWFFWIAGLITLIVTAIVFVITFFIPMGNFIISTENVITKLENNPLVLVFKALLLLIKIYFSKAIESILFLLVGGIVLTWLIELYCDQYSLKRTSSENLLNALISLQELGEWDVYHNYITHPPPFIRRTFIKFSI